ncbi:hypothetical protein DL546_005148 [Coniochaeta pulveracea]|uniref:Uncharacterized protein n=1 Tax=Coniochaeta pulveracea TaxID=177199 RepID=A0A420Y252_9PEZI|nr:hypothetical protein DL546_005148 [Coniochaeta pulveracea]
MANGKSDIPFPPMEELLRATRRKDAEPGSVAGVDRSFSASVGASGNSDALEPFVTKGSNPDDKVASSQQPQTFPVYRSPAQPSAQHCRRHGLSRQGVFRWSRKTGQFTPALPRVRRSRHALLRTPHAASLMGEYLARCPQESRLNIRSAQTVSPGSLHRGGKKAQIKRAHRAVAREAKAIAMTKLAASGQTQVWEEDEHDWSRGPSFPQGLQGRSRRHRRSGTQSDGQDSCGRHLCRRRRNTGRTRMSITLPGQRKRPG